MRYPDKLYIEFNKKEKGILPGVATGQSVIIRNFGLRDINVSRRENHPRSGVDYNITKLHDYSDILEIELTRKDKCGPSTKYICKSSK